MIFIFFLQTTFAKEVKAKNSQTRIRSDIIDIKRKSQTIKFINNVVVEKDDSSLLAQEMTVFYDEKKDKSGNNSIKKIDAIGDVKIFSEEFIASGKKGYYLPNKNVFILEQDVIVNNGTSIASGRKFIYNLTTKKGSFVGETNNSSIAGNAGDKRVVVIIGEDISTQSKENKRKK